MHSQIFSFFSMNFLKINSLNENIYFSSNYSNLSEIFLDIHYKILFVPSTNEVTIKRKAIYQLFHFYPVWNITWLSVYLSFKFAEERIILNCIFDQLKESHNLGWSSDMFTMHGCLRERGVWFLTLHTIQMKCNIDLTYFSLVFLILEES